MATFNILHLSDLHIGEEKVKNPQELVGNIGKALENQKVDAVVFSGDIFDLRPPKESEKRLMRIKPCKRKMAVQKGQVKKTKEGPIDEKKKKELIDRACVFFGALLESLKDQNRDLRKEDFLFVAGNHDLYRQEGDGARSLYNGFLKKFYGGHIPDRYKKDKGNPVFIKAYDNPKKIFFGFDSNMDPDKQGKEQFVGHISKDQLNFMDEYLKNHRGYQEYDKIAFFHYPCIFFEERRVRNTEGIMNNSYDVLKKLAEWDIKIVMHGHKHQERQSIYRPVLGQKIYMFAAGAIGEEQEEMSGNIIEMGEKLRLKKVVSKNRDGFTLKEEKIYDSFIEGLLYESIEKCNGGHFSDEFNNVLEMIGKLYLSHEQLNLLQSRQGNVYALVKSICNSLGCDDDCMALPEGLTPDEWSEINKIAGEEEIPKKVKNELQHDSTKKCYVAFARLGRFFTKLYDDIKRIRSVRWNDMEFNLGTSCYYVYFKSRSRADGPKAQEELERTMEKYQDRLYELQDFLCCMKLNIKNIFLELQDDKRNNLRHCSFEASVPRLIQILTGSNIYYDAYSFVRELIQNSVDAVSFREEQDEGRDFEKKIYITLGRKADQNYLEIRDYGIGMKQEIIDRFFATLGRSYYKEYAGRKDIEFNSVSNFGIGFLSVFKACSKITVCTKHFEEEESHMLEINSKQGHYTIQPNPQKEFQVGTEVTCYLEKRDVDYKEIIHYIKKIMLDIKYGIEIQINDEGKKVIKNKKRKVRKKDYHNVIFVPFNEETKSIEKIEDEDRLQLKKKLSEYMETSDYGILIRLEGKKGAGVDILSAGILLKKARLKDIFNKRTKKLQYMKVTINFPPNWLNIDVSRERANGICEDYIEDREKFKMEIYSQMKKQLQEAFNCDKDLTLGFFKEASTFMKIFKKDSRESETQNVWGLKVRFESRRIKFFVKNKKEGDITDNLFHKWVIEREYEFENDDDNLKRAHKIIIDLFHEDLSTDESSAILQMSGKHKDFEKIREVLQKLGLDVDSVEEKYLPIVLAVFLEEGNKPQEREDVDNKLKGLVEAAVWDSCMVQNTETKNGLLFSISYDNREQDRIDMTSDDLQKKVDNIAKHYGVRPGIDKYTFIWDNIIWEAYKKFGYRLDKGLESIRDDVQKQYEILRDQTKSFYAKDKNAKIDNCTIASCYMGALLYVTKGKAEWKEHEESSEKYRWILKVGFDFLYMWKLSKYHVKKEEKGYKKKNKKFRNLKKQGEMKLSKTKEEKYENLLAMQDKKSGKYDVLFFAEILRWVNEHNERLIQKDASGG